MLKNLLKDNIRPNPSIYILALIAALLPMESALSELVGSVSLLDYAVVVFLVVHVLTYRNFALKIRKEHIILVPLLYIAFSVLWSVDTQSSSNIMYLSYLLFFIVLLYTDFTEKDKRLFSAGLYYGVFVLLLFTVFFGRFYRGRLSIDVNGYIDPNFFCTGFVIIVALLLCMIKNGKYRLLNIALLFAIFVIVILSGSRGALMAIGAEIACYAVFVYRKNLSKIIIAASAVILLMAIAYKVLPSELIHRFNIFESFKTDGGSGRLTIWKNMFIIYGNGNGFTQLFGYGRESCVALYKDLTGINYSPHNVYIKILVECGAIGLLLAVLYMVWLLRNIVKNGNAFLFALLAGISIGSMFLDMDNTRVIWFIMLILSKKDLIRIKDYASGENGTCC